MIKHVMSDGSERESIEGLVVPAGHPAYKVIQKMREEGAMAGAGIRWRQQPVRCPCRKPGGNTAALAEGTAQACPAYSGGPVLYRRRTGSF